MAHGFDCGRSEETLILERHSENYCEPNAKRRQGEYGIAVKIHDQERHHDRYNYTTA
jgi:hypothetical protein